MAEIDMSPIECTVAPWPMLVRVVGVAFTIALEPATEMPADAPPACASESAETWSHEDSVSEPPELSAAPTPIEVVAD